MSHTDKFTIRFYFRALTGMLGEPRKFFSELPVEAGLKKPLGFLLISSLFFVGASLLSNIYPNPLLASGILLVNAVGMVFIAAGIGYGVMVMTMGRTVTFARFLSVYALSSGVTLLASWVPFFALLMEPWKWWLIGTGMTRGFGLRWQQALLIISLSIGILLLFFGSLSPLFS